MIDLRVVLPSLALLLVGCPTPGQAGGAEVDTTGFRGRMTQLCRRGIGDPALCAAPPDGGPVAPLAIEAGTLP